MNSHQFRREEEKKQRRREQEQWEESPAPSAPVCPACGAQGEPGDRFCSNCGEPMQPQAAAQVQHQHQHQHLHAGGRVCPHCHKPINDTCELCPHCGRPVSADHCTFCGAPFEGHEAYCGECGSPRAGITCPVCGEVSFRSFCSHCNAPLNDAAQLALREAQKDPNFRRAQELYAEMAQMEEYLERFAAEIEEALAEDEADGAPAPDAPGLSKEGQSLQSRYAAIMKQLGQKVPASAPSPRTAAPKTSRREKLKLKFHDAKRILDAYTARAAEMDAALRAIVPPPNMTPQQQRDYVSARKVAITTIEKKKVPQFWTCNYCGCQHSQPSECAEPQLGGVWTYQTVTVSSRVWRYME